MSEYRTKIAKRRKSQKYFNVSLDMGLKLKIVPDS
jgi:hypothetical protein